jgi:phospholipase A-2-activating protein
LANYLLTILAQKRKYYPGDKYFPEGEYDYLFNVENDEGATSILPYNEDQGTWEVAEKYCCREGLSKAVLSQITEFIKKNSK